MIVPSWKDPRWPFAALLSLYAVVGCSLLGLNRTPGQIVLVVGASCLLDLLFTRVLRGRVSEWPLSAYITGMSLSLLVNYAHGSWLPLVPVLLAIGSKHLITLGGRHVYNPSLFGLAVSLLIADHSISPAPAYQWGGSWIVPAFFVASALALFVGRVGRGWLVLSFLLFYAAQTALRAQVMRWHLPPESLFLGTMGAPSFYLFAFYMITDPRTSPPGRTAQIWTGFALAMLDLYFHTRESLYTFYYAGLALATARLLFGWIRPRGSRLGAPERSSGNAPAARFRIVLATATLSATLLLLGATRSRHADLDPGFRFDRVDPEQSGVRSQLGTTLEEVDPRVAHVAKWVLSVGSAVACADVDLDGRIDLFLTGPIHRPEDRAVLYRNLGEFRFERVPIPCLDPIVREPSAHGLVAGALFADWDQDGDSDLFLPVAFGSCRLLANRLQEAGELRFEDVTRAAGLEAHSVSLSAQALDYDRDGSLDLFVAQAMAPYLPDYEAPTPLNLFALPAPAHPGDRRMFHFMHASWYDARNGGRNRLYRGSGGLRFHETAQLEMAETHWSLAIGASDLDLDGYTDLYVANDFGPDDLYQNRSGAGFVLQRGRDAGSIGRDTYKGMNATCADFDRDLDLDLHVSNVHQALQAEGSLLWMNHSEPGDLRFQDQAARRGVLNERRFGWGAAAGDLDNDGWIDLVQANGMVDDTPDSLYPDCPDYWYVNEKVMRSGPEIHAYADRWGDLRGRGIFGRELNRVYLNRGAQARPQFVDLAPAVGWTERTNSRGIALVDLDDDGRLDAVVTHPFAVASIYRNRDATPTPRAWIGIRLMGDGVTTHRDALGSRCVVRWRENGVEFAQVREGTAQSGFSAQGDPRLHFGLGETKQPVDVEVSWYGGETEVYRGLEANAYYELRAKSAARRVDAPRVSALRSPLVCCRARPG